MPETTSLAPAAREWWRRVRAAAYGEPVDPVAADDWEELERNDRKRIEGRAEEALDHPDPDVRGLGWYVLEEMEVAEWDRAGLSGHARLEVAVAHRRGRLLDPEEPVPGCGCATCLTLAAGGARADARETRDAVDVLAGLHPEDREREAVMIVLACATRGVPLPRPGVLALLAERIPGALREGWQVNGCPCERCRRPPTRKEENRRERRREWERAVRAARSVSILEVARRLGLGEPEKKGGEVVVTCPLHDDSRPSLRLNVDDGLWYCFPCGEGGDALELYVRATGLDFAEAVRDLTGTRRAA